ncbi:MAG: HEAT repeat domain-containing protein, partial [Sphingomonas sp.]|nr:HEAT repeat domain-containing protein [Sphingomonas sp.]
VFAGSPIKRIGRDRMVRNALIAAGNARSPALVPPVVGLLDDAAPVVRGAAVWALARLDPDTALRERQVRMTAETDIGVVAEWAAISVG